MAARHEITCLVLLAVAALGVQARLKIPTRVYRDVVDHDQYIGFDKQQMTHETFQTRPYRIRRCHITGDVVKLRVGAGANDSRPGLGHQALRPVEPRMTLAKLSAAGDPTRGNRPTKQTFIHLPISLMAHDPLTMQHIGLDPTQWFGADYYIR